MSKTIKCTNCKKESVVNASNIGAMAKESNYKVVLGLECKIHWLCSDCHTKAEQLAKELVNIFDGNEDVALSCILINK